MLALALSAVLAVLPQPADSFDGVVISYCRLPGSRCVWIGNDPQEVEPDGEALNWCCGVDGGACVQVQSIVWCDEEMEYAVVCEWGMMTTDGEVLCFDAGS